jgi:hypothetical protein
MSDIVDELGLGEEKREYPFSKRQVIFFVVIIGFVYYMIKMLYGPNNLLDLLALQEKRELLSEQVSVLNSENATLQKSIFEQKLIEGEQ